MVEVPSVVVVGAALAVLFFLSRLPEKILCVLGVVVAVYLGFDVADLERREVFGVVCCLLGAFGVFLRLQVSQKRLWCLCSVFLVCIVAVGFKASDVGMTGRTEGKIPYTGPPPMPAADAPDYSSFTDRLGSRRDAKANARRFCGDDHFLVHDLGVDLSARHDAAALRKAFKALAVKLHPDKVGTAQRLWRYGVFGLTLVWKCTLGDAQRCSDAFMDAKKKFDGHMKDCGLL